MEMPQKSLCGASKTAKKPSFISINNDVNHPPYMVLRMICNLSIPSIGSAKPVPLDDPIRRSAYSA
jgi:hypothetical protein